MRQDLTLEESLEISKQLRLKVKKLQGRMREVEDGRADWKSKYMECKQAKECLETKFASFKKNCFRQKNCKGRQTITDRLQYGIHTVVFSSGTVLFRVFSRLECGFIYADSNFGVEIQDAQISIPNYGHVVGQEVGLLLLAQGKRTGRRLDIDIGRKHQYRSGKIAVNHQCTPIGTERQPCTDSSKDDPIGTWLRQTLDGRGYTKGTGIMPPETRQHTLRRKRRWTQHSQSSVTV